MDRTPLKGEKISFTTWSEGMKRLMATRGFTAEDEKGDIIMRAASRWMFMDLEERKPVAVPKEMEEKYTAVLDMPLRMKNTVFLKMKSRSQTALLM